MSEWISVKDRLPADGEEVLVVTKYGLRATMKYRGAEWTRVLTCRRCNLMTLGSITHWMPLPEPPLDDKEDEA